MTYYYALLTIFAVLCYMIVVDKNVAEYIVLIGKLLNIRTKQFFFMIKMYPRLTFDNFMIKRKLNRLQKKNNDKLSDAD